MTSSQSRASVWSAQKQTSTTPHLQPKRTPRCCVPEAPQVVFLDTSVLQILLGVECYSAVLSTLQHYQTNQITEVERRNAPNWRRSSSRRTEKFFSRQGLGKVAGGPGHPCRQGLGSLVAWQLGNQGQGRLAAKACSRWGARLRNTEKQCLGTLPARAWADWQPGPGEPASQFLPSNRQGGLVTSCTLRGSFNGLSSGGKFWKADEIVDKTLPRDFALILRGLYDLSSANGGGSDDEPDQDPMVPSSRAIVVPGLLSQRRLPFLIHREIAFPRQEVPFSWEDSAHEISAVPVFHPAALEKSAYRRSADPSRTSKKGFWITHFVANTATHFLLPPQETTFFTDIASKACLASKTIPFFQYPSTIELQVKTSLKTMPLKT
ncbi:hypothetical protein M5K25_008956 [Dendrobium thyrsiflorum]|uniref:Uncharacterized protein n=1 Tax=Dendrobium thyrsiflorum TaxID=117978 RepID=A0ABD0VAB3_DENTH